MDESSNNGRSGAGLILSSPIPECIRIEYALLLEFKASNNEVEYEALMVGLRLTQVVEARHHNIFSDSQFVVRHVNQGY